MRKKLSDKQITKLFNRYCLYKVFYRKSENECHGWSWKYCDECKLRNMPYYVNEEIVRDVCFAIWHDGHAKIINA